MTPKKTNPLKLEDILFNLCKQVEQQNKDLITIANIVKFNLRLNDKYNAKLRRLEQEEAKFFRWNCIILSCIGLPMSILMWWCE